MRRHSNTILVLVLAVLAAGSPACGQSRSKPADPRKVVPGITVLLRDSLKLLQHHRIALVTNQTGLDENGKSDIDLLFAAAPKAFAKLVALFSPEHGIRGTEDRENIKDDRDTKTGLPIFSLYTNQAVPPSDSVLRQLGITALVVDLFDVGTRTWTYVGTMLYSMRAAAKIGIPVFILDRPNPLGGFRVEGPMLDPALANPDDPRPDKPGLAYALYSAPLRHGMTMGEIAQWLNDELKINADLHVETAAGWKRDQWWDDAGLPWVKPSPNLPSLTSALLYPALVALEGSNVSVGRGTPTAFQRFGAPWMDGAAVAKLLEDRSLSGVRFVSESFTPSSPTDSKFSGKHIGGVRIDVTDRARVQSARVGAAIVWALHRLYPDSLKLSNSAFDLRFGSAAARVALLSGTDPDEVIDREMPGVVAWQQRTRKFLLYR